MTRDDLAVLDKAYNLFDSANSMSSSRLHKKLVNLLGSEEFLRAMFRPDLSGGKENTKAMITNVYDVATKRSTIRAIATALCDCGYFELTRTSAVFLASLVNLGMATVDGKASDLGRRLDHNDISKADYQRSIGRLEDYQDDLNTILKIVRRVVKSKARALSMKTRVPKELCVSAYFSVPGPEYLDQWKLGFYLKTLLGNIYGYVNVASDDFDCDYDDCDWGLFFKTIFGSNRIPDVASLILLEGVGRLSNYDNATEVRACWDAITQFALKALNRAPESIRDQMIEIYLKRLNKMLANHDIDLRIDLRCLDNFRFENLAETVEKYRKKIDAIMGSARKLANASPETAPA